MGFKSWWNESPHTFKGILFGMLFILVLKFYFYGLGAEDSQYWKETLGNFIFSGLTNNQSDILDFKPRPAFFIISLSILVITGSIGYLFDKRKEKQINRA